MRPWLHNLTHLPQRLLRGKVIHAYWFATNTNFGDAMNPVLFAHYGFTPIYAPPARAQIASSGSILQAFPSDFSGIILGTGLMSELYARPYTAATILAVRGSYTRDLIHAPSETVLGDPGLLLPFVVDPLPTRQYLIGFVPHYVDKKNAAIAKLCARYPAHIRLIDVQQHPITVLREIAQCEYILSSSLHGLVIADALDIPNGWLVLSDKVHGNGFKFRDYYSAFDCSYEATSLSGDETIEELAKLTHNVSRKVKSIQSRLDRQFKELAHLLS